MPSADRCGKPEHSSFAPRSCVLADAHDGPCQHDATLVALRADRDRLQRERDALAEELTSLRAHGIVTWGKDEELGRLLRQAREAWGDTNLRTHRWGSAEYDDWYVYSRNAGHSGDRVVGRADNELDALRAALQSAPTGGAAPQDREEG